MGVTITRKHPLNLSYHIKPPQTEQKEWVFPSSSFFFFSQYVITPGVIPTTTSTKNPTQEHKYCTSTCSKHMVVVNMKFQVASAVLWCGMLGYCSNYNYCKCSSY